MLLYSCLVSFLASFSGKFVFHVSLERIEVGLDLTLIDTEQQHSISIEHGMIMDGETNY